MPIISIKVPFYNWSSYYAMAVIELGQAVQAALADQEQTAKLLPSRQDDRVYKLL